MADAGIAGEFYAAFRSMGGRLAEARPDALVVVTEWNEFRALSPARVRDAMRGRVVVDLRNVFDPAAMSQAGFAYQGVGRRA